MAREKGSVVLKPEQAKLVNNVLSQALQAKVNVSPEMDKKAWALYGNIYQFPNYGRYTPRFYVEQDSETGLDSLSRMLLLRWSRELTAQVGWIEAAIRVLASFSVGDAYLPEYVGKDKEWGKYATEWLIESFYPNCCTRGRAFDFQTVMFLESQMLDMDGDVLCVYGHSPTGFPKFQIIPSHRIRSVRDGGEYFPSQQLGPYPNTVISDGVLYDMQGTPIAYNVINPENMVNTVASSAGGKLFSTKDAMLIFDPRYFDKGRGRPTIGSAILQAMSLQEIERYLMEKLKVESCVAIIEKTPSGEGPLELQQTLAALNQQAGAVGIFAPSPNVHGVEIVDGPTMRYVKAQGGDIKTLSSTTPANETAEYIDRLESHILATLGVPHALLYSPDDVSGRITEGVAEIFNKSIIRRQKILDNHGRFIVSWAVANAMKIGQLPENYDEDLYHSFRLTHPDPFTINKGNDERADLDAYKAGLKSMNEIAKKRHTTAKAIMSEIEEETTDLFVRAKRISDTTGVDFPLVVQAMRESLVQKASPFGGGAKPPIATEEKA